MPVIRGAAGTTSKSFRKYLTNIPGKHEIKELHKTAIPDTVQILREVRMPPPPKKKFIRGNNSICATICNHRIAVTLCNLQIWSHVINNNNNNNNEFSYNAEACPPINTDLEYKTAPLLPILGTAMMWMVNYTPQSLYQPSSTPVTVNRWLGGLHSGNISFGGNKVFYTRQNSNPGRSSPYPTSYTD